MKLRKTIIGIIVLVISFSACNNHPKNSVFSKFPSSSKEYKNELAGKIKANPNGVTFIFNKYKQENGQEYLDVQVSGNDFEANGLVLVKDWNKLEEIKRTKGQSYSGAELRGLELAIESKISGAQLVYKDLEKIVD